MLPTRILELNEHEVQLLRDTATDIINNNQHTILNGMGEECLDALINHGLAMSILMKLGEYPSEE